jgi:hypothetical protein
MAVKLIRKTKPSAPSKNRERAATRKFKTAQKHGAPGSLAEKLRLESDPLRYLSELLADRTA